MTVSMIFLTMIVYDGVVDDGDDDGDDDDDAEPGFVVVFFRTHAPWMPCSGHHAMAATTFGRG